MELWSAFLIGLVGSLHCAGMCGPLTLALPSSSQRATFVAGRAAYNLGRLVSYSLLGGVFGLVGRSLALAGLQRWASLGAGAAILASLAASSRYGLDLPVSRIVSGLKAAFAAALRRRTFPALFLLGVLNGFLPCGLVYVACTSAVALGGGWMAIGYMVAFGVGTIPMMLGVSLAGKNLQIGLRLRYQKLIPACLIVLGTVLMLRGMSLGIPFLSPDLSGAHGLTPGCH
jgi:sulfite exporter TauE/SafE